MAAQAVLSIRKDQAAAALKQICKNQLADCQSAIKAGTKTIAANELDDAIRQIKRLAAMLEA